MRLACNGVLCFKLMPIPSFILEIYIVQLLLMNGKLVSDFSSLKYIFVRQFVKK